MIETFEVSNVKCSGCAGTLKKALLSEFGTIEVDLEVMPRKITLDINDSDIDKLKEALRKLGYPLTSDKLTTFETVSTTAKSFVSCAIGKVDNAIDGEK